MPPLLIVAGIAALTAAGAAVALRNSSTGPLSRANQQITENMADALARDKDGESEEGEGKGRGDQAPTDPTSEVRGLERALERIQENIARRSERFVTLPWFGPSSPRPGPMIGGRGWNAVPSGSTGSAASPGVRIGSQASVQRPGSIPPIFELADAPTVFLPQTVSAPAAPLVIGATPITPLRAPAVIGAAPPPPPPTKPYINPDQNVPTPKPTYIAPKPTYTPISTTGVNYGAPKPPPPPPTKISGFQPY